ncbi:thermosome subunit [Candidatus Bathyarchaeota archaeon]|nr:MAG: thermosome subunit [Candidatus Bathyarchaeota archaeon]TMI31890.1 MAG: thermosome subunit [Candidatus Bathyarchaeota archaeon]
MRVLILKEGTSRSRGRDAQRSNIMAAKVLAETVRSTIGPKGMDKMLVGGMGDIVITNDGATIMKEMDVQNPAAKMLVEVAKTQDSEVGDGTTTAVVLAGELLAGAEALLDKDIHTNIIIDGYRDAAEKAQEILDKIAVNIKPDDQAQLRQIALTSLNTKGIFGSQTHFAELAVDAVRQVMEKRDGKLTADIDLVKVMKKHGRSLDETELVNGVVIDKEVAHAEMPKKVTGGGIALLNAKLEIEKTETDAKINIDRPEDMYLFIEEEEKLLRKMAEDVAKTGARVLFTEKGVDDQVLSQLAQKGILTVKNVSSGDMEKLAKATGGSVVGILKDLTKESLGQAKLVEEVRVGDDKLVYVRECRNPKAVTIVIRGGSEHVVDEAERSLHDAICVVRNAVEDGKILAGGGAPEAELAKRLRDYAVKVGGREQLAVAAFAEALEAIPVAIAQNAGINPIDIMVELKSKHNNVRNLWYGVNVPTGKTADMWKMKVVEPLRVKKQVIKSAVEAVTMLLRVDDVISSKGTGGGMGAGGPSGMPPGMPPGGMDDGM